MPSHLPITDLCPDNLQNDVEKAALVALIAHRGQKDLDGRPVILHPFSVATNGATDDECIVGFLHDIVEDTDYTLEDLRAVGFSETVLEAVQLLTHEDGISYEDYLKRIKESGNELALHVKITDVCRNLARSQRSGIERLEQKYWSAYLYLLSDEERESLLRSMKAEQELDEMLAEHEKRKAKRNGD